MNEICLSRDMPQVCPRMADLVAAFFANLDVVIVKLGRGEVYVIWQHD